MVTIIPICQLSTGLGQIPFLMRTQLGRRRLIVDTCKSMWPMTRRLASWYRSTLARRVRLIAVVGSYGKTTTVRAISAGIGGRDHPQMGNSGAYIAHALLRIPLSSRFGVVEVGIDGKGQMALHSSMLRPDVVVVTSIGWEHHRTFGTLEGTRSEKATILKSLPASGTAVLNYDDLNVRWMMGQTKARTLTYGTTQESDVYASDIRLDWPLGTRFSLHFNGSAREILTQLVGRHHTYPLLAASTVALAEGLELNDVLQRLERLKPTPGRMQPVPLSCGAILLRDEYKSSLETIERALDVLEEIEARRKIVVMGEVSEPPGSQGPIYRRLGQRIAEVADRAIFLGGNYQRYAAGARRGGLGREAMIDGKRDLLKVVGTLRDEVEDGDVVLIKGRDTQRLDRIALALSGIRVTCGRTICSAVGRCDGCPELAQ